MCTLSYSAQLRVRKSVGEPYSHHVHDLAAPQKPILLRSTHALKYGAEVTFHLLVTTRHSVDKLSHRHCLLPCTLEHVVYSGSDFSHLSLPEEKEHVLVVFAKPAVLVQEA